MMKKGADVNEADKDGYTALMWAARHHRIEIAKLLIEKGADINAAVAVTGDCNAICTAAPVQSLGEAFSNPVKGSFGRATRAAGEQATHAAAVHINHYYPVFSLSGRGDENK